MFLKRVSESDLVIGAPAKVNLYLEVLGKRPDGFHDINSLFQAVSLFDRLRFKLTRTPHIDIKLKNNNDIPTGPDNLVARAFRLLQNEFALKRGLDVALEKNIPVAAGLGGGSADAAATIIACNELFHLGLARRDMADIGLQLGSDIPFFFGTGQAVVTGRGENVEDRQLPTDYWLVLVNPAVAVSTRASYRALKMDLTKPRKAFSLPNCRTVNNFVSHLRLSGNDFEMFHLESYPGHEKIKDGLEKQGASLVRMSGTGPTYFGLFVNYPEVRPEELFNGGDWHAFTVRPITLPLQERS
ncbi:MAG: 4-(cytidine 5'-diphospho)-2-C-methyl-D-erythritol kinase [candidate division Zixibacteria bacterium]|nr:4-(cytidine 5'-diphospho)-2-C-methyl-D-erythritol kinase [candidate division Zixibacteria bacterium]